MPPLSALFVWGKCIYRSCELHNLVLEAAIQGDSGVIFLNLESRRFFFRQKEIQRSEISAQAPLQTQIYPLDIHLMA